MEKLLFFVVVVAATLVGQTTGWKMWHCFPDNATKARCFADFPNAHHHSKSWMRWFMPQAQQDSYQINDTEGLDTDDFIVSRIESDPNQLCENKDGFVAGLKCLLESIETKCPFLKDSHMLSKYSKYVDGVHYICSRIDEMDTVCLHVHFDNMWKCKKEAKRKMRDDFDAIGHRHRQHHHHGKHSWSHHHSSHSHDQKNHTRGDTNSTSSGRGKWSFSKRGNYSASGGNGTSSMGGGSWWNRNRNTTTDNSKTYKMGEARAQMYCRFKYVMIQCTRDAVEPCHGDTAQIMYEFMRNMSDPDCQDKMAEWEDAEVLQLVDDCEGATCSGRRLPLPWLGLLVSIWVVMMKRFY